MQQLLQTADVATLAEVVPDTIRRAAREGRIAVAQTTGRGTQLFTREAVEAFIAAREARLKAREAGALNRQQRRETA